jgi:hypothetical protein
MDVSIAFVAVLLALSGLALASPRMRGKLRPLLRRAR